MWVKPFIHVCFPGTGLVLKLEVLATRRKDERAKGVARHTLKWAGIRCNELDPTFFFYHFYPPTSMIPIICRRTNTFNHRTPYEPHPAMGEAQKKAFGGRLRSWGLVAALRSCRILRRWGAWRHPFWTEWTSSAVPTFLSSRSTSTSLLLCFTVPYEALRVFLLLLKEHSSLSF